MSQLENVNLSATGNVYFDGKCVSYTFHTADGTRIDEPYLRYISTRHQPRLNH